MEADPEWQALILHSREIWESTQSSTLGSFATVPISHITAETVVVGREFRLRINERSTALASASVFPTGSEMGSRCERAEDQASGPNLSAF